MIGKSSLIQRGLPRNLTNKTSVFVAQNGQYLGHFTFADTLRPEAKQTIQQLRNLGIKHLIMVTGDKKLAAQKVAKAVALILKMSLLNVYLKKKLAISRKPLQITD